MRDPAFFGVGVTASHDNPAEAALLVLVDSTKTPESMPGIVGGLRVRYLKIGRLHVTKSKFSSAAPRPTSCALKSGLEKTIRARASHPAVHFCGRQPNVGGSPPFWVVCPPLRF